jgi:hypothetical protein
MLEQAAEVDAREDQLFGDARSDELPADLAPTAADDAKHRESGSGAPTQVCNASATPVR